MSSNLPSYCIFFFFFAPQDVCFWCFIVKTCSYIPKPAWTGRLGQNDIQSSSLQYVPLNILRFLCQVTHWFCMIFLRVSNITSLLCYCRIPVFAVTGHLRVCFVVLKSWLKATYLFFVIMFGIYQSNMLSYLLSGKLSFTHQFVCSCVRRRLMLYE